MIFTVAVAFVGAISWWRNQKSKIYIEELKIFPIKSCAGITLQESNVTPYGLENDRSWLLIYEESKNFITQRQDPKMCLIETFLKDGKLSVKAPGMDELEIGKTEDYKDSKSLKVRIWEDDVLAKDCGDVISNWFSNFLGKRVRLVSLSPEFDRPLELDISKDLGFSPKGVHFQDAFPIHLATMSSLNNLQSWINDRKIVMDVFRPNITVTGDSFIPWDEDTWKILKIGDLTLQHIIPCSRCSMPNIDPKTSKVYQEPRNTLIEKRTKSLMNDKERQYFGIHLVPKTLGKIKVGQCIEISK